MIHSTITMADALELIGVTFHILSIFLSADVARKGEVGRTGAKN